MKAEEAIQFVKDHLIECPEGDNCGRCQGAREVVKILEEYAQSQLPKEGEEDYNVIIGEATQMALTAGFDFYTHDGKAVLEIIKYLTSHLKRTSLPTEEEIEEFLIHKVTSCTITEEADLDDCDNHYYNHKDLISALKGLRFPELIDDDKINAVWEQFSFKLSQVVSDSYSVMEESDFKAAILTLLKEKR